MKNLTDYTEAELRAMAAGRDMDALVAAALGCKVERNKDGKTRCGCGYNAGHWNPVPMNASLCCYSTDPGEAFKALIASGVNWFLAKGHGADAKTSSGDGICLWPSKTGDWARDICVTMLLAKLAEEAARKPKGRG